MWFWAGLWLFAMTAGYTSTFVAQYSERGVLTELVQPVQGIYFSLIAGGIFSTSCYRLLPYLIALGDIRLPSKILESDYLFAVFSVLQRLPMLVMSAINGFFSDAAADLDRARSKHLGQR